MSDTGRKSMGDKVGETVKPDSQKSYAEQMKQSATGTYDKVARDMQPDESKSGTQKTADRMSSTKDDTKDEGKGMLGTAKEYASSAQRSAGDMLNSAAEYISGGENK